MNTEQIIWHFLIWAGVFLAMYLWPKLCLGLGGYTYESYERQGRDNYIPYQWMQTIIFLVITALTLYVEIVYVLEDSFNLLMFFGTVFGLVITPIIVNILVSSLYYFGGDVIYRIRMHFQK